MTHRSGAHCLVEESLVLFTLVSCLLGLQLPNSQTSVDVKDARESAAELLPSDARRLRVTQTDDVIEFEVEMAQPLSTSMYTSVHVWIDADRDPSTGVSPGRDLWIAASIGSRFMKNDGAAPGVAERPLDLRRVAINRASRGDGVLGVGGREWNWTLDSMADPPSVAGKSIGFALAKKTLGSLGLDAKMSFVVLVETGMSDQPLVAHVDRSRGLAPTTVDGRANDWKEIDGEFDEAGDLHASLAAIDLEFMAAAATVNRLLLAVDCARTGFLKGIRGSRGDVRYEDSLHVAAFDRTGPPRPPWLATFARGGGGRPSSGLSLAQGTDGFLEIGIDWSSSIDDARVTVWSEAVRFDRLGPDAEDLILVIKP